MMALYNIEDLPHHSQIKLEVVFKEYMVTNRWQTITKKSIITSWGWAVPSSGPARLAELAWDRNPVMFISS